MEILKNKLDGFVKSRKTPFFVIPEEAGIQVIQLLLDAPASRCGAGSSSPA